MVAEISISRNYSFFIDYVKNELVELLFEGGQTPERLRNLILVVEANPDRTISNVVTNFICDFNKKLPKFFVRKMMTTIMTPCGDHYETLKEFVLESYQKRA